MLGFLTFWFAFVLFLVIELLAMIPFGGCCCCAWIAVLTYYRHWLSDSVQWRCAIRSFASTLTCTGNKLRVAFGMSGANEFTTAAWIQKLLFMWIITNQRVYWIILGPLCFSDSCKHSNGPLRFVATVSSSVAAPAVL